MGNIVLPPPFRCSAPECEGHEKAVTLFNGICYLCLHDPKPTNTVKSTIYDVKVWNCCAGYTALAGLYIDGYWWAKGLPVAHMDQTQAVGVAVHRANSIANLEEPAREGCPGCRGDLAGLVEVICDNCRQHLQGALGEVGNG